MYIIIVGCGKIGSIIAKEMANYNHHISVIDRDQEKIETLGSGFNGLITRGIEFDHDNLIAAGIERADALLALSENDNVNITVCLVAKNIFHVKRVISQVVDPNRRYVYEAMQIEIISPVRMGVNALLGKLSLAPVEKIAQLTNGYEIIRIASRRVKPILVGDLVQAVKVVVFSIENQKETRLADPESEIHPNDIIVCALHIRDRQDLVDVLEGETIL
jgi:trk system potassium uptake protein TrkA